MIWWTRITWAWPWSHIQKLINSTPKNTACFNRICELFIMQWCVQEREREKEKSMRSRNKEHYCISNYLWFGKRRGRGEDRREKSSFFGVKEWKKVPFPFLFFTEYKTNKERIKSWQRKNQLEETRLRLSNQLMYVYIIHAYISNKKMSI